jgi:hypothetical protein
MPGQLVGPPVHLRLDVGLQVVVAGDGHPLLEVLERGDGAEAVTAAELGVGVGAKDLSQQPLLRLGGGAAQLVEPPDRALARRPEQQVSRK